MFLLVCRILGDSLKNVLHMLNKWPVKTSVVLPKIGSSYSPHELMSKQQEVLALWFRIKGDQ
jgi:hypothetical protein